MRSPHPALPDAPRHGGTVLDARLHLLDRQLIDATGDPVGIVDDLEVDGIETGADIPAGTDPARVSAIITGRTVLTRILGGTPPPARLHTVPWRLVANVGTTVRLSDGDVSIDTLWVEKWLRANVISRIPGGRHAAE